MSKNSTLGDTVLTTNCINKDENFKDVIRYKAIASLLIKFAIPEFKDKSLSEISMAIINRRDRKEGMSKTDILEDEVDFLPSEAGTKDEKNTISDSIFGVLTPKGIVNIKLKCIDREFTVNTEMQNSTSGLGYNVVSRAVYYGASLLRDTVPAGDTKYTNIHKVYTIWFCNGKLKLQYLPEVKDRYIHRYGIRRFYDDIPNKNAPVEKEADLIEVVMVELPKLPKNSDDITVDLIYRLFNETNSVVNKIETIEKVNLTKVKEGVFEMLNYEERSQVREQNAKQQGLKEGRAEGELASAIRTLQIQLSKGKKFSFNTAVQFLCDNLGTEEDIAKKAATEVIK